MFLTISNIIKSFLPDLNDGGDIRKKFYTEPKIKPPRRNPSTMNKSDAPGYMKDYMKEYRGDGKDYQKMPDKVKQYRREQRKKFRDSLKKSRPMQAHLIDQELSFWQNQGQPVDCQEFELICNRCGFDLEEQKVLAEELFDLNLILL
jgi:hypothetical protein